MAIGFPARLSLSRSYPIDEAALIAAVGCALQTLGWSYKISGQNEYLATVPLTGWSWGEEFKAVVGSSGKIDAHSKCIYGGQWIDLGKNRRNLEVFFAMVEHCVKQDVHGESLSEIPYGTWAPAQQVASSGSLAGKIFVGCLAFAIVAIIFSYFIAAVIGLLTGSLYLPSRGRGSDTIHGIWARIISVVILAVFVWILIWVKRNRNRAV
jgi:hypothetical protein